MEGNLPIARAGQKRDSRRKVFVIPPAKAGIQGLNQPDLEFDVSPAKAGVQGLKRLLKKSLTAWAPAFAGETNQRLCL
jgi:hypothetical protein